MRYMLLIHKGTTPTPHSPTPGRSLSEDERNAIDNDYRRFERDPRRHPG